jgi:hypothetical protein
VSSKALRILREIFDSSLPSEITGLFTRPDVRAMRFQGQREAWRAAISTSVSLSSRLVMKADSRLPLLSVLPSGPTLVRKPVMSSQLTAKLPGRVAWLH